MLFFAPRTGAVSVAERLRTVLARGQLECEKKTRKAADDARAFRAVEQIVKQCRATLTRKQSEIADSAPVRADP